MPGSLSTEEAGLPVSLNADRTSNSTEAPQVRVRRAAVTKSTPSQITIGEMSNPETGGMRLRTGASTGSVTA